VTLVKICGLTHPDDVAVAVQAGADRLGFVIDYPTAVPWNLDIPTARALMERAGGRQRVAVVGGGAEAITRIVAATGADLVQLHGDEPPAVVEAVARTGVPVIKALRAEAGRPAGRPEDWIRLARSFVAAGAAEILLDSRSADRPAGTGIVFNWDIARAVVEALQVPVILAGGLDPATVAQAIAAVGPAGVDVITGVAGLADRKDPDRVRAFVAAVRGADQGIAST
jgi:phosphoribosylanthranilate isomerase